MSRRPLHSGTRYAHLLIRSRIEHVGLLELHQMTSHERPDAKWPGVESPES